MNCCFHQIKENTVEEIKKQKLEKTLEVLGSRQNVRQTSTALSQTNSTQRAVEYLTGLSEVANYPATAVEHLKLLSNFEDLVKTEEAIAAVGNEFHLLL